MPLEGNDKQSTPQQAAQQMAQQAAAAGGKFVVDKAKQAGSLLKSSSEKSILNTNEKAANARLLPDKGGNKLRSQQSSSSLRQVDSVSMVTDKGGKPASRMAATEKKLQKKMRGQYRRDYAIKGGITSPLRIESSMKSKLRTTMMGNAMGKAGNGLHSALRFARDEADQDSFGTQKTFLDIADKAVTGAKGVYKVSRQAKHFRLMQKEKKIAKLLKREDKIARQAFKQEFKAAYAAFKNSPVGQQSSFLLKQKQKKLLKKRYMKNAMKQYQKAKRAGQAGRMVFNTGFSAADKVKDAFKSVVHLVKNTKIMYVVAGLALLLMIPSIVSVLMTFMTAILGGGGATDDSSVSSGGFSEAVEAYRPLIIKLCEEYNTEPDKLNLPDYVNAMLAIMEIETHGTGTDPMQASECGYNEKYPREANAIKDAEYSCRCGVQYARDAFIKFGVEGADDFERLAAAVQGYNFGIDGWYNWISERGGKYSVELAQEYSDTKMPVGKKGTPSHGQKFLDAYKAGMASAGSGAIVVQKGMEGVIMTALNQERITEYPPGSNTVVYNTDFYGSEVSGDKYPWCCAFVWWCFEKSGNGNLVPKTAGCSDMQNSISQYGGKALTNESDRFKAKRGDLVIFKGGSHIGIVLENKGSGHLVTIEGNTSPEKGSGNEFNGGCVAKKERYVKDPEYPITAVVRPNYPKDE